MVSDADLAVDAAERAGRLLLDIRERPGTTTDIADLSSDRLLGEILREARPGDAILSEEKASTGDRLTADRVWIIDPLDGTREYGEAGRVDWAVHVALWQRDATNATDSGGRLIAGAVAIPARGEVWSTATGPVVAGAARTPVATAAPLRRPIGLDRPIQLIGVSRSRPPAWALAVAAELGAEVVPMGSAGAKVAAVLRGELDAYLHDGGQYEWDSAAPVAVAHAYGYAAARADGSALAYNRSNPYLPDLVVCVPGPAPEIFDLIARFRNTVEPGPVVR
ncbi:MAG: inositol monophosphatase [Pseudonocardiales bacterium]|nr:inositol monophosphatase [Pseudonocardiales bacterium]